MNLYISSGKSQAHHFLPQDQAMCDDDIELILKHNKSPLVAHKTQKSENWRDISFFANNNNNNSTQKQHN